jgi:hypothetical protein
MSGQASIASAMSARYDAPMQVVSGPIVEGKVVVNGDLSLPDGTAVTVLAHSDEAVVTLPPEELAELLAALDEADREEGVSPEELFARMRRLGAAEEDELLAAMAEIDRVEFVSLEQLLDSLPR